MTPQCRSIIERHSLLAGHGPGIHSTYPRLLSNLKNVLPQSEIWLIRAMASFLAFRLQRWRGYETLMWKTIWKSFMTQKSISNLSKRYSNIYSFQWWRSEFPVDSRRSEFQVDGRRSEFPVDVRRSKFPADGRRSEFPVDGRRSEFPVDGRRSEFPVDGRRSEYPVYGRRSEFSVDGRRSEFSVDGRRSEFLVDGRRSEFPVDGRRLLGRKHLEWTTRWDIPEETKTIC